MKQLNSCNPIKQLTRAVTLAIVAIFIFPLQSAWSCSRILYETGNGTYITGRTMDWNDPQLTTSLWVFPRGMARDGGTGKNSIKWKSKYGSVIADFYGIASVDGINEKGLAGNALYLAEADYGDAAKTGKPTLKVGAWLQYYLDNFATVKEVVNAEANPMFTVVAPILPNGQEATAHISLSDPTGDSAILEYLDGKLVIHHNPKFKVMTNSPTYDQQLALNAYWEQIGGSSFLPGTISATDRFVRLSYNLKSSPKFKDQRLAVASVFSQLSAMSVPLGMEDPNRPNISMTHYRTVADHANKVFYFESAIMPATFWVDLKKVDLNKGAQVKKITIEPEVELAGEVSVTFTPAEPFKW
ncbi:MAG: linear amide C-N hydrolase [Bacteroidota bacterium]|nr:linear amide C-N hydrolase [Bacteroidota bacterium]